MPAVEHQYVDRATGRIQNERLFQDKLVRWLYAPVRENAPRMFRLLTSRYASRALSLFNYDLPFAARISGARDFIARMNVDLTECVLPLERLNTPRKVFERQIRYWERRPLPDDPRAVVAPSDSRVLMGSLRESSSLFLKDKFFSIAELLDTPARAWHTDFSGGDFAVFRLTPDKYHYNHAPVSGRVVDCYALDGAHHSCNPSAVVTLATPFSKNRRVVTLIDTDVPDGTQAGLVAMVEVVALMIGDIVQCYSQTRYDNPQANLTGTFVCRGQPKSLFRPGSSTVVLLFQAGRVRFAEDLVANMHAQANSRFSFGFGRPLVETDIQVRSSIGVALPPECRA